MRWRSLAGGTVVALALVIGSGPAVAQYGGGGGGGGATHNPQAAASVSDATLCPGQQVQVTSLPGSFAPGTTVTVFLLRLVVGALPVSVGTATAAGDGSVTVTVTVPGGAVASNYLLFLEGTAIPGGSRALGAAVVVNPAFPGCSSQPASLAAAGPGGVPRSAVVGRSASPSPAAATGTRATGGSGGGGGASTGTGGGADGGAAPAGELAASTSAASTSAAGRLGAAGLAAAVVVAGLAVLARTRRRAA